MKRLIVSAFAGSLAMFVSAANYEFVGEGGKVSNPFEFSETTAAYWKDVDTGITPIESAITIDDTCRLANGKSIQASIDVIVCGVFHLGSDDGSSKGTYKPQRSVNAPTAAHEFRWHAGILMNPAGGAQCGISGDKVVLDCPAKDHIVCFTSARPKATRSWSIGITAPLECSDEALVLKTYLTNNAGDDCWSTGSSAYIDAQIFLTGDNSKFAGHLYSYLFGHLALGHANAAGAPETLVADKIRLGANGRLAVQSGVAINPNCGITITGDGARIIAKKYSNAGISDCTDYALAMPITGDYGLAKYGDGKVTLTGDYSAGDLVVVEGTLAISNTATFSSQQRITVKSGATLQIAKSKMAELTIDAEEGAVVTTLPDIVAYDDATATVASPISLPNTFAPTEPVNLALSEKIAPFVAEGAKSAALELKVAVIAAGAADVAATNFVDDTEKTYGLPNTSFEVRKTESGEQEVYLLVKPYARSTKSFDKNNGYLGSAANWTDGKVEHSGWDYLLVNGAQNANNINSFAGDSLTIAGNYLYMGHKDRFTIESCCVYPGSLFRSGGFKGVYSGSWELVGNDNSDPIRFVPYSGGNSYDAKVGAALSGGCPISFESNKATNNTDGIISGVNTAYVGKVIVTCKETTQDTGTSRGTRLQFSTPENLGGARSTLCADATTLSRFSYLQPTTTMVLGTENRGITIDTTGGGFLVNEGVSFTLQEPLTVNGTMLKDGDGDLILDCETTATEPQTFKVRGGTLKPLTANCCANLDVVFSDSTLVLDYEAEATRSVGLAAKSLASAAPIPVRIEDFPRDGFEIALATVTHSEEDLSGLFAVEKIKGHVTEVTKVAGETTDTYVLKATRLGMAVYVL